MASLYSTSPTIGQYATIPIVKKPDTDVDRIRYHYTPITFDKSYVNDDYDDYGDGWEPEPRIHSRFVTEDWLGIADPPKPPPTPEQERAHRADAYYRKVYGPPPGSATTVAALKNVLKEVWSSEKLESQFFRDDMLIDVIPGEAYPYAPPSKFERFRRWLTWPPVRK